MRFLHRFILGAAATLAVTVAASAHTGSGGVVDFRAGAHHPFSGLDHVLAMLAVGLIAARAGDHLSPAVQRQRWLLPLLFLAAMLVGGVAALLVPTTGGGAVEHAIAASVIVFGLLLVVAGQLPESSPLALVPMFAFFHGYAHLAEGVAQAGRGPVGYGVGMLVSSVMLLAGGLALGLLLRWRTPGGSGFRPMDRVLRGVGGAVAAMGVVLLLRTF